MDKSLIFYYAMHMSTSFFTPAQLDIVKRLALPQGTFAIFGSGPMAVRGIRTADDIDILVKHALWQGLCDTYTQFVRPDGLCITMNGIEIADTWPGIADSMIGTMIDTADILYELPFVQLQHVLAYKKHMNRDKDKTDMILIENYLQQI